MLQTSARLLSLLLGRRYWSGAELAERLEVTERTLRRDIDRLRRLGYSVEGQPGVAGGYGLAAGTHLPPLTLFDDEALAISIGLRTAESSLSATIGEAALRALTKLEHVLPARLRRRANVLRERIRSYWAAIGAVWKALFAPARGQGASQLRAVRPMGFGIFLIRFCVVATS